MAFIYVTEHGSVIGLSGGHITVKNKNTETEFPRETIEGICVFGNCQVTTQCMKYCFENMVPISFFSSLGRYYGKLDANNPLRGERLIKQVHQSESESFCKEISRKIIWAKINNQLVVAKRYLRERGGDPKEELFKLRDARRKVKDADSLVTLRGYEGIAARHYFKIINYVIEPDYTFPKRGRSGNDPVNAMLNFGYSCVLKEITGEVENRGLSPYIGLMHSEHDKMPSLSCDLIEEWRPVIVDSVVISMITKREVKMDMFSYEDNYCRMPHPLLRLMAARLEERLHTESSYLFYLRKPVSFRDAIWHQVAKLASAIETSNPDMYTPLIIR